MTHHKRTTKIIIEKKLGIPANYQYQAIRSKNFLQSNWHKNKLLTLEKIMPFAKGTRILDLGTGSGNFELAFAHTVKKIVGVDYNDEALAFLKKQLHKEKIKNVDLVFADIRDLSSIRRLPKFDYVVSVDVIEHIKISDSHGLAKNIYNLIKPGGKVCIITPNYQSPWVVIENILDQLTLVPKFKGHQHLAKYHRKNLTDLFKSNGFTLTTFRTFNTFSYMFPTRILAGAVCTLELALPFNYGNMIAAVFVKK